MLHSVSGATHEENGRSRWEFSLNFEYHFCRGKSDFLLKKKLTISSVVVKVQYY